MTLPDDEDTATPPDEEAVVTRKVSQRSIAEKEVLSFQEAMEYLGVSRDTLLQVVRAEKIPAAKLFTRWRMKKSDIDFYIRTQKNFLVAEAEQAAARREALDTEKLLKPKKPRRTITTALLLKQAVDTLSTNPCYLVGPASQSLLNTHVTDGGGEWDVLAKGSLAEVLSRAAELFFSEESPKLSYRREVLTLPAKLESLGTVKEKLTAAISLVGLSRDDGNKLKMCADELVTNALHGGGAELRVIIETGQDDVLLTVINEGRVDTLASGMPGPEAQRGRGIELIKKLTEDFLLLSSNDRVIATVRKVRTP